MPKIEGRKSTKMRYEPRELLIRRWLWYAKWSLGACVICGKPIKSLGAAEVVLERDTNTSVGYVDETCMRLIKS